MPRAERLGEAEKYSESQRDSESLRELSESFSESLRELQGAAIDDTEKLIQSFNFSKIFLSSCKPFGRSHARGSVCRRNCRHGFHLSTFEKAKQKQKPSKSQAKAKQKQKQKQSKAKAKHSLPHSCKSAVQRKLFF